jgi:ribosome-associated protein
MAKLRDLKISLKVVLPARLLSVRYSRSRGPGGQRVNKVETKVDVRLDLAAAAELLGNEAVARIREALVTRLDGDGALQIVNDEHRNQSMNLEAALVRMESLIRKALAPVKKRRKTKPTASSRERRLASKRQRSQIKGIRRDRGDE